MSRKKSAELTRIVPLVCMKGKSFIVKVPGCSRTFQLNIDLSATSFAPGPSEETQIGQGRVLKEEEEEEEDSTTHSHSQKVMQSRNNRLHFDLPTPPQRRLTRTLPGYALRPADPSVVMH
jgi:hypothetical protein